ncbi:MAG: hypothetical protein AAGC78_14165 [Cellvibrio sp.]|uniref:hypothetical protein n=1 Tax=Cellvibrio sp. TaxID=1965322 RepID=UPI0031AF6AC1
MKYKTLLAFACLLAPTAFAADITINQTVKYHDEKIIATKIKSECVNLGPKLVASTEAAVQQNGWSVIKKDVVDGAGGVSLKLTIANAHSSGNAFIGHHKSVAIIAELFKDGKLVDTYTGERSSSGGFGAGFKGSCAVLERCVNTLGKDVSEWLSKQKI